MKAIILDYSDGSVLVLPIPKEWEDDADGYVRQHPCYDDSECSYMINEGDSVRVYNVVREGIDADGNEMNDYVHALDL